MNHQQERFPLWVFVFLGLIALGVNRLSSETEKSEAPAFSQASIHVGQSADPVAPDSLPPVDGAPYFLQHEFVSASLAALKKNGSDLSRPMPSKHLVRCDSPEDAQEFVKWGERNGFVTGKPEIFLGHGGVEFFDVELSRTEVPELGQIQQQGLMIRDQVRQIDGTEYVTWVGEIISK